MPQDGMVPRPSLELHVLVAEDNLANQKVARLMLDRWNCRAVFVFNGREAVERLKLERFDIVLMDIQMPVMDGIEATVRIREAEVERGLPRVAIVATTANSASEDRERCLAAGMDDYLIKPIQAGELLAALLRWTETIRTDRTQTL